MSWLIISVLLLLFIWWGKNTPVENEIDKTNREVDEFIKQMEEKDEQNK